MQEIGKAEGWIVGKIYSVAQILQIPEFESVESCMKFLFTTHWWVTQILLLQKMLSKSLGNGS